MAGLPNGALPALDLLVPWELPLDQPLAGTDRLRVACALRQLLDALRAPAAQQARLMIDQALAELGEIATQPANTAATKTPLPAEEVEDYDRYFGVNHVHTASAAICVVRGLLVSCQTFMALCCHTPLNQEHVEQQKQGFVSYVYLLARVFAFHERDLT